MGEATERNATYEENADPVKKGTVIFIVESGDVLGGALNRIRFHVPFHQH